MVSRLIYNNKIMLTLVLVLFLSVFLFGGMKLVQANESIQYEKSFATIEIEAGDTLSSLAAEYSISSVGAADYIQEVKEINNLKSDTIHAGCYLLIPVYHISK